MVPIPYPKLSDHTVLGRNNKLILRRIGKETMLVDVFNGTLYHLNDTAYLIWKLLVKKQSIREITQHVVNIYKVSPATVIKDMLLLLKKNRVSIFKIYTDNG